jgi:hypothetical protein
MSQRTQVSTKKANRSVNGKTQTTKVDGLREKSLRDYEEILGKSLSTENFA